MGNRKVLIVGAGIGGLAAGYRLRQRGYDVEILEALDRPGGRMVTLEHRGDRVDVGAQFYHTNGTCALGLIDEVGLNGSKRPKKNYKIQYTLRNGDACVHNPRAPYSKFLGLRGNLNLYWFVFRHLLFGRRFPVFGITKDIPEYDNASILDLCGAPSDQGFLDYLVTPMASGATMATPEWMSLYHFIRIFRGTLVSSLVCLSRGVASLAEEIAKHLSVEYGAPVGKLVMEKGRVVGVQMAGDGSVRKADHVIVAVTPPAAAAMMPDELGEQRWFFNSILYSTIPLAVFFLDRPLRSDVLYYFNDPGFERSFCFATDAHAKVPEMCPSGKSTVTGWSVYPRSLELLEKSDADLLQQAREDIEWMIPGFSGWIEDAVVVRHPFVNALYTPGAHRKVLDFLDGAERLRGVSFVSCVLSGSGMEAAILSAEAAVRRVCGWGGME